jgi:hypothetical protein
MNLSSLDDQAVAQVAVEFKSTGLGLAIVGRIVATPPAKSAFARAWGAAPPGASPCRRNEL